MKQKFLSITILTILSSSTLPTFSQETNISASEILSPVTVTANYNTGVADTVTITSTAINDATTSSPRDLLRNIPSVDLENRAVEGFAGFRIRGMGGSGSAIGTGQNRVAINVDGMPLPDAFKRGHAMRSGVAPFATDDLKAVEIIRGPESSMSGKSGLAGTVKFVTKDPADYYQKGKQFGGNVRTGYSGANKAFSIGTTVAGQFTDSVSAMVSYNHRKSDEMPNYDKEKPYHDNGTALAYLSYVGLFDAEKMADRIDGVDIKNDNIMGKVVIEPSENHKITLKGEYSKRDFNADVSVPKPSNFAKPMQACKKGNKMACMVMGYAFRPQKTYQDHNEGKRTALSLRHDFSTNTAIADGGYWQTHYQNYKTHRNNELAYGNQYGKTATTDYEVKGYGIEANLNKTFTTGSVEHTLSYGLNAQKSTSKSRQHSYGVDRKTRRPVENNTTYQPDTTTRQITAYINDDVALANGKLHIMPGIEFTNYNVKAKPTKNYKNTLIKSNDNHFSWRLGTTYELNDNHQLFAGYRQGYKVPSFAELNSSSGHGRINNPNLKPEESSGFTVGLRSQGAIGSQTISAFHDSYKNLTVPGSLPTGEKTNINMNDKVVIYGVEYQGELDLHNAFNAPEGLKLRGSLAYAKGKNKQTNQPYSDVEPLNGSVGLAYDAPSTKWGMAVTTNFSKAKKAKDIAKSDLSNPTDAIVPVSGYGVTDLTAYFKPVKGMQINAGVYNLFDKKYAKWSDAQYNGFLPKTYNQITETGRFLGAKVKYDF